MKPQKIKRFPVHPHTPVSCLMTVLATTLTSLCLLSHLCAEPSVCPDATSSQFRALGQNTPLTVSTAAPIAPVTQDRECNFPRPQKTPSKTTSGADTQNATAYAYYDVPLTPALQRHLSDTCKKYNLPVPVMLALMEVESGFDPAAVSPTGDYGLCQINQVNHSWLERQHDLTDMLDPHQNITAGCIILGTALQKAHGDLPLALMSYANGPTGAAHLRSQGVTATNHSRRVLSLASQLQEQNFLF